MLYGSIYLMPVCSIPISIAMKLFSSFLVDIDPQYSGQECLLYGCLRIMYFSELFLLTDSVDVLVQLLLVNLPRPSPNLTHLLLGFDVNQPMEKTTVQPNYHYR